MKIKKILFITFATITLWSCSDDDSNVFADDFDNGAVLEIVATGNNSVSSDTLEGGLNTTLEYRDAENGVLLDKLNVYITFIDNTENAGDSSNAIVRQEVLLRAVDATEFSIGQDDFPRYNLIVTTQDFLNITNNSLDGIAPGDDYIVRFEIVLTDGRVFSVNNTGSNGGLTSDFNIITTVG
ncbi:hypothetical protein [uncultured Dokdonia sp.]|uniref:hypothetical protein n=1 Tax=uncultured Dokdonia sp. TaxID=575653 RepID=UPI00260FD7AB|nr:hypothetical protein [uncultured Dokdonia sp.]